MYSISERHSEITFVWSLQIILKMVKFLAHFYLMVRILDFEYWINFDYPLNRVEVISIHYFLLLLVDDYYINNIAMKKCCINLLNKASYSNTRVTVKWLNLI